MIRPRQVSWIIFILLLTPIFAVHACDPLGCLLINKDQDLLALITVTSIDKTTAQANIEKAYFKTRDVAHLLKIEITTTTQWGFWSPEPGDHYFISLTCKAERCKTKWGAWRASSSEPATAKLLEVTSGDHAAIQWFMNGKGSSFFGMEDKMFAQTPTGDVEIYPLDRSVIVPISQITPPWLKKGIAITVVAILSTVGTVFYTQRKARSIK